MGAGSRFWCLARDGDHVGYVLARRHYSAWKNRRPRLRQFVGPGHPLVLIAPWDDALFVWRKAIRDDGQVGVCCAIFRNESIQRSSDMILEAERLAWAKWPEERRLFTHVDPRRCASVNPGYCFKAAGWRLVRDRAGQPIVTTRGLLVLEKFGKHDTWRMHEDGDQSDDDQSGPRGAAGKR